MNFSWSELFPGIWSYEFLGFVTGILCVALLLFTKNPRIQYSSWYFSIVSAAVYLYLFREWTLYGNMALQLPFIVISIQGAYLWRGQVTRGAVPEIPITYASKAHWRLTFALSLLAILVAYPVLSYYNDASPLWDGFIFTLSIGAIYLQLRKYVQAWYLWILVDLIAVPFHFSQNHGATALLYLAYMILCFIGLKTWREAAYDEEELDKIENDFMSFLDRNEGNEKWNQNHKSLT